MLIIAEPSQSPRTTLRIMASYVDTCGHLCSSFQQNAIRMRTEQRQQRQECWTTVFWGVSLTIKAKLATPSHHVRPPAWSYSVPRWYSCCWRHFVKPLTTLAMRIISSIWPNHHKWRLKLLPLRLMPFTRMWQPHQGSEFATNGVVLGEHQFLRHCTLKCSIRFVTIENNVKNCRNHKKHNR